MRFKITTFLSGVYAWILGDTKDEFNQTGNTRRKIPGFFLCHEITLLIKSN